MKNSDPIFGVNLNWFSKFTGIVTVFSTIFPSLTAQALDFPTFDGSNNNLVNEDWGRADTPLLRLTSPAYQDGYFTPRFLANDEITPLPNPRDISNVVVRQDGQDMPNFLNLSDWLFQWGQLVDHDLDLNEPATGAPPSNIPVNPIDIATGQPDPLYSPRGIFFTRNEIVPGTGTDPTNPAQNSNKVTSYLDASMVYGSSQATANELRTFRDGKLKSQIIDGEELLPLASEVNVPLSNPLGIQRSQLFAAGDTRVNEQLGLIVTHTLMVREHNRVVSELKARLDEGDSQLRQVFANSGLSEDEFLYQAGRRIVTAEVQIITYNEFLPLLVGDNAFGEYTGYDPTVNPGIAQEFANAAFRFGHTTLSPTLIRANDDHEITRISHKKSDRLIQRSYRIRV